MTYIAGRRHVAGGWRQGIFRFRGLDSRLFVFHCCGLARDWTYFVAGVCDVSVGAGKTYALASLSKRVFLYSTH